MILLRGLKMRSIGRIDAGKINHQGLASTMANKMKFILRSGLIRKDFPSEYSFFFFFKSRIRNF